MRCILFCNLYSTPPIDEETTTATEISNPHFIPEKQALQNLAGVLSVIDGPDTRTLPRSVQKVAGVTRSDMGVATRAGEQSDQPVIYLVSFGEGEGSAVVAADNRLSDPVIAIFDKFVITEEDLQPYTPTSDDAWRTEENMWCEEDQDYYVGMSNPSSPDDKLALDIIVNYIQPELIDDWGPRIWKDVSDWEQIEYVPSKLNTKWYQSSPFNTYFHLDRPAGCVTIAVAQILAYNKFPKSGSFSYAINGITVIEPTTIFWNWDYMRSGRNDIIYYTDEIYKLIKYVADGCKVQYNYWGSGGTFSTPERAKDFMRGIGYTGVSRIDEYSPNTVVDMLKADCPVFIAAMPRNWEGHAWVIDGYVKYKSTTTIYHYDQNNNKIIDNKTSEEKLFVYCNWGQPSTSKNGYFADKVFNPDCGPALTTDENGVPKAPTRVSGENGRYTWHFRIVKYNKPPQQ